MTKVLYITANPKAEEHSFSLRAGKVFLNAYRNEKPKDEIVLLDLYQSHIPMLDREVFDGWGRLGSGETFEDLSPSQQVKITRLNTLLEQFMGADKYVFVTPMWNFSIPPMLKAYIDAVCVAGKTFAYTEEGAAGLLQHKKAVHIQARGGHYSDGPLASMEFGDRYLQTILGFLGIEETTSIFVEGMGMHANDAERIAQAAFELARETATSFAKDRVV